MCIVLFHFALNIFCNGNQERSRLNFSCRAKNSVAYMLVREGHAQPKVCLYHVVAKGLFERKNYQDQNHLLRNGETNIPSQKGLLVL